MVFFPLAIHARDATGLRGRAWICQGKLTSAISRGWNIAGVLIIIVDGACASNNRLEIARGRRAVVEPVMSVGTQGTRLRVFRGNLPPSHEAGSAAAVIEDTKCEARD